MAGYTRQSVADIIANAVIKAAPVNAEFNAIRDAFNASTGHKHDGTSAEGAYVPLIADPSATNKVVIDTANNRISFYNEVSSTAVEQIRLEDGVLKPVTDDDIDLGATGAEFKDLYIDGIGYIDSVVITGGTIDDTVIGGSTPAAGTFTSVVATTADIDGGTLDGVTIGGSTAAAGTFTTLTATGTTTITTADINGGAIDNTIIGASSTAAGSFTTVTTSGQATLPTVNIDGGTIDGTTIGNTTASSGVFTTISSTGGITGDLTGNVSGNLTGNVTGDVTGNITGNVTGNVTASTGTSTFNNMTINGTMDVTGTTIVNVTDPVNAQDAATKNYVDTNDALKLNLSGGTMSGAIAMSNNKVTNVATPTASSDAATKGYVDQEVSALVDAAPGTLDTLNELAAALGDDPDFATTVTDSIATKLPLAGGTMSGDITMGANAVTSTANPTTDNELARKGYVDAQDATKLSLSGGTMSGAIAMGTNKVTGVGDPTANQDAATKAYVDTQDGLQVTKSGDSMSGNLAMGSNNITGLATPTANDHATNKTYVDGILGSATAASASAAAAATSESNAASSASAASTSETNAANSASAAASSYDQFDDRYLGGKSSAPTVDNDGNALLTGALYWDSTLGGLYVWNGTSWEIAGQRDELLQAVGATIADTAVDVFVYDTSKDSDGGAWRKRTQGTSWYNETLNTATRGSRKEFPAVAVIVVEDNAITIYDGDDPSLPMWMVFTTSGIFGGNGYKTCFALNGVLACGTDGGWGIPQCNFIADYGYHQWTESVISLSAGGIASRNTYVNAGNTTDKVIVNSTVNDVAMTVLPNAPIDAATGLPVPTIAVATDGGVSVIKDDGTVVDIGATVATDVTFDKYSGDVFVVYNLNNAVGVYGFNVPSSDQAGYTPSNFVFNNQSWSGSYQWPTIKFKENAGVLVRDNYVNMGTNDGLYKSIDTALANTPSTNFQAKITSTYNTGWMNGDIKLATLSDTDDTDVTGSELVTNGTFDSDTTGWTAENATLSVDTNRLKITSTTANTYADAYQAVSVTSGNTYTVSWGGTAGTGSLYVSVSGSGANSGFFNTATRFSYTFTATSTGNTTVRFRVTESGSSGVPVDIGDYAFADNVSVRLAEEDRSVNG